jgi:nucleotide-binding universal stress UspA family protein
VPVLGTGANVAAATATTREQHHRSDRDRRARPRRRSAFPDGSVAERVVRSAPCPVLTVHAHDRDFIVPDALAVMAGV